jgi:hypothetical protein
MNHPLLGGIVDSQLPHDRLEKVQARVTTA